ncbi:MAG: glycosyltransferase [Cetobacterium sp.]
MRINIVGPLPPLRGGVSIYIQRLTFLLTKNSIEVENYTGPFKKYFFKILRKKEKEMYHINLGGYKIKVLLGILGKLNKKIILTIHGASLEEEYNKGNVLVKNLIKWSMRQLTYIICVNEDIRKRCLELGVDEEKLKVISPYLNPIMSEEDYKMIDEQVWEFIETKKRDDYRILTANGNIRFYNNQDLYGLDLLIDLVKELKDKGYKICLVFALLGYDNHSLRERKYFEELLNRIKDKNIDDKILIFKVKNSEYYPIIEKSDIFLRPTNTDGDAISCREAIFLKKPNIASDVTKRPKETLLFKSRNLENLVQVTEKLLKNYDKEKKKLNKSSVEEAFNEILAVYKKIDKER